MDEDELVIEEDEDADLETADVADLDIEEEGADQAAEAWNAVHH